ncbi:hypothetical protein ARMGADRAFT_1082972 [Armillaria gallica]|uniref:Uncharacterized protein n=1 Tax=Armillaria gallica TaxID=47427 RepID=A0A2H3DLX9_ARMGA|nr:hypothetical protein ARMGADRAFT_1082972 [Armillaria gallica]
MPETRFLRKLAGDRQTKARHSPFAVLTVFRASFTKIIVAILTTLNELTKFAISSSIEYTLHRTKSSPREYHCSHNPLHA